MYSSISPNKKISSTKDSKNSTEEDYADKPTDPVALIGTNDSKTSGSNEVTAAVTRDPRSRVVDEASTRQVSGERRSSTRRHGYHGKYYSRGGPAVKQSFLYSFHGILSSPEYEDIVTWLPHGRGFIVVDKARFEKEILSTFLPNTKYASFTRRLKRWNFIR